MCAVAHLPQLPSLDEGPEGQATDAKRGEGQLQECNRSLAPPARHNALLELDVAHWLSGVRQDLH